MSMQEPKLAYVYRLVGLTNCSSSREVGIYNVFSWRNFLVVELGQKYAKRQEIEFSKHAGIKHGLQV